MEFTGFSPRPLSSRRLKAHMIVHAVWAGVVAKPKWRIVELYHDLHFILVCQIFRLSTTRI